MVIVAFPPGEKYAVNYTTLDQYDYGQILRIQGLKLPKTVEVHFSTQETGGTSITRVGVTKDGVTDVLIPDSVLENGDTTQNYSIFAFVYVTDATSGKTEYRAKLEVKARPKPEIPGGGDNPDIFHEAVLEVRKSAEKAEEAQKQAEGWAHGREDLPERAEDNAMHYAGKASEDAQRTAEDRKEVERLTESNTQMQGEVAKDLEEVKKLSSQAQTSATNAALSERKSEEAATKAETAQAGAEAAENNAELAAQKTGQDKTAVEQAKKLVQQIGQEVLNNKNAVDKTVQDFGITAQQALADVNNAGQTQTERVQSAGTTAVENIKTAQNTATRAVETAKTEAIKAVQTEGTTQIGNVSAEGEKQVQAVQQAAQEIVADREQIQKNTTDIAELRQKKADAIVESVSGTLLNVKDSSGAFFENFSMAGKTTQDGTPTPDTPVEIVNAGQDGTIEIKVTGKNLIPFPYPDIKEVEKKVHLKGVDYTVLQDGGVHLKGTTQDMFGLNICTIPFKEYGTVKASNLIYYDPNNNKTFFLLNEYIGKAIDMVVYPQVECGTVSTDYEPYRQPQTITLQLDRPLTKWDRLEKREGVWGIVRKGKIKILDGTENWYHYPAFKNGTLRCYCVDSIKSENGYKKSLCSHFKNVVNVWFNEIGKYGYYSDHGNLQNKYFVSDKQTVDDFKAWLMQQKEAGTPVEIVYKTAEETWEPLPEETQLALNALHTNYPTTVVTNSEDTEMELSYIADTKNYYLSREQTLQKQIFEIQNALISQKISGGGIKVTNSAKLPVVKLAIFGKSEQTITTGAQLLNYYKLAEISPQYYAIERGELKVKNSNNVAWSLVPEYGTLAAGTYTISGNNVEIRDASKNTVIATCIGDTFSKFTINEDTAIKIKVGYGLDKYPIVAKAMLNKGDSKKPYEPYTGGKPSPSPEYPQGITSCGESGTIDLKIAGDNAEPQTLTIPTPNGLLGLKVNSGGNYTDENGQQWIADEIDLAKGKRVQRIAKKIFDGSEALADNIGSGTSYFLKINDIRNNTGMCNYGKRIPITGQKQEELTFSVDDNGIYLYTTKSVDVFKKELEQKYTSGNPVCVTYALKTPVETDLPPETISAFKQLHTNYPTTLVSNNADAGMELTYTADTQSYVDSKITTLSKAML